MKLKQLLIAALFFLAGSTVLAQSDQTRELFDLAAKSKNWLEGFQKNIGKNEFSYHSFRNDVSESLITRCKDGKMTIEWATEIVPENFSESKAGFLWIASFDLTPENLIFDVYINGEKRFELPTTVLQNWTIDSNGGQLSYLTMETDQHGDVTGYMAMEIPKSWLRKGESQIIKIVGRANDSNVWLIVFQADDALKFLHNSIEQDVWMELVLEKTGNKLNASILAPFHLADKTLDYSSGNKTGKIELYKEGDFATGSFTLPASALTKSFELTDPKGSVFIADLLGEPYKSTKLLAKTILLNESSRIGDKVQMKARRNYKPKTVSSMLALSDSHLAKGKIFLMNSSHQDIAWMDSPEKCVVERDTMLLTPLFEMAQKNPKYRFDVEDALMIKEFIERHPDKKELVKQLLNDGRISCGSTYTQPYEEMHSGESLARQFYFGAKWLKDEFDYDANVYWNEDVPGRTLQMMQIMRKAGTKYMMISRHERGLYNWYSPDGSFITAFTPGHYANAFTPLQKKIHEAAQFLASSSLDWAEYYAPENNTPVIPLLSDWDMSPAKDYSHLIRQWENIDELQKEDGSYVSAKLPKFEIASTPEFFNALSAANPNLVEIKGERPAVWLYIHGPSHQKALKAKRASDILLTQAEKFATANAMVDGSFNNYPTQQINAAWEANIYPDHGWGGKHGDITDALFLSKYEFAKTEAEKVLNQSLYELSAKVKTDSEKGRPLIVFNSLNWIRNDVVSTDVQFAESDAFSLNLYNTEGTATNIQLTDIERYSNGSIKRATINFIAENVPSIGYKTYYLKPSQQEISKKEIPFIDEVENDFYKLKFSNGGLSSIFDKKLKQELVDGSKFVAGEVFTMRSEGNGAGEFDAIQQPHMQGFDKTGNYKTRWSVEENGPVFSTYKYRQQLKNAVVEQRVILYHTEKRIDFETALLNWEGELYREFRLALPLNMTDGQVVYEVPFGVVEVGKDELEGAAGERYTMPCKDFHPRGIENWISSSNSDFGITMSSSVVAADWIDPTDNPVDNQILQPILLASRKSCHWEGNDYLQTGNHYFKFSVTSHQPGWKNGAEFGRAANEKLHAVWTDNTFTNASLPESQSFFNVNQKHVLVSTVKKAEDSEDIVVRLTDLEGKDKMLNFSSYKTIKQAKQTNLIEYELLPLDVINGGVRCKLGHHSIETIKLNIN
ncbi:glycosyl hydrolase-related protein [Prolixibacteraceae bacterium Z1-6]|uniref:Glycosyl hydrolase-related protein n=1 Tax=Draconibacterium aestuarii TaxID=2998507 RepID=A0A9X3FFU1_9BACT|nr:glycosyl hydrolase-related protein [Prolixibacteraceae bacterium Z1-6]